jgi:hypothetical protein
MTQNSKVDITKDNRYMDGQWDAERMSQNIERTNFGSMDEAIKVKTELIEHFEKEFGHTREDFKDDKNYSYNCGMLDKLIELKDN